MNDIEFWKKYNEQIRNRIEKVIAEEEEVYMDLHIHSNHSTDGKQTLKEIINHTKKKELDIISITDHDNIDVYDELYELVKDEEIISPIIIPGIEFTVANKDYGSQCHILQYFINPKEKEILKDIEKNERAGWNRAKKQFERINENKALQYFCQEKNIQFTLEEYKKFLIESELYTPEYTTLAEYIRQKLMLVNINVLQVFEKLEEFNRKDKCEERRIKKSEKYKYLRQKYEKDINACTSTRLLLSILAVKGVDDSDYTQYDSEGSLSVNEYGQIQIEDLNDKYLTIFAHPNADRFNIIKNMKKYNKNIKGIENNYRSYYNKEEENKFYEIARNNNFVATKGSDSHDNNDDFYCNMDFYKVHKNEIKKINEWKEKEC